jgi:pimeloyl-ACP methyl ester carboxylesterase
MSDPARAWDGPVGRDGPAPEEFVVTAGDRTVSGESLGEGSTAVVLLHGLTATRRYVVHGSKLLPRRGALAVAFDARGHGRSDPPGNGQGYDYSELANDLEAVLDERLPDRPVVLAGHSMGAHTAVAYALRRPERLAGLVAIGPAVVGAPPDDDALATWDGLAGALEEGGVEQFVERNVHGLDPDWRERVARFTRERMEAHRDLGAVARALREVPRSLPFDGLSELEFLDLPALVVASHDEADPSHPYAVAEAWAERIPRARLISEEAGDSPLAWQGGRLSREIWSFCESAPVRDRLGG